MAGLLVFTLCLATDNHYVYNGTAEDTWVTAAINAANLFVNFAALDTNNNGYIDRTEAVVYLIPAGYEDSGSSQTPSVWAQVTNYSSGGLSAAGKLFPAYAMSGELNDSNVQHPIGAIAHEMGHLFCGLPDLYDTSNRNKGMGFFSLMAAGSWGKESDEYEGMTPTNLDAWSREYLGWSTPEAAISATPISLAHSLSTKNSALKLISPLTSATEYFLVENRQPIGWDRGLRGAPEFNNNWAGGLLVMHIDIAAGTPGNNDINNYDVTSISPGHQGVVPVQASTAACNMITDGTTCSGHPATLFYSANNANFTPVTTPNTNYYSGSATNLSLVNISAPAATMTGVLAFTAPTNKTLNVSKTGTGSGIVTSSLAGISCGATCSAQFVFPTSLALTAIPSADSAFTGWSGACTGTANPCIITSLDDSNTVQANFSTAVPIVSETFSLASLPVGWSASNTSSKNWQFNGSPCQFPNGTGGSGNYALAELYCETAPMSSDAALYTPSYNLSLYSAVTLSFKTNFTYWYSSTADVDISNDGGATWNTVWRKTGGTPDSVYGPMSEIIDVTALVSGKSDVKIRFRYYTNEYGNMWQVDDFALNGVLIPPVEYPLTVTLAGTGSGSINSIPSGFICPELGGNSSCSKSYVVNTPITLTATPDSSNSVFAGWNSTAPCSGTGNCVVTMDSAKSVTGTFTLAPLVTVLERAGIEFSTISDAYGDLNTTDSNTIRVRVNSAPFGPLILNRAIAITLKGGFDPAFSPGNTGFSKIGSLIVATGSLTVERIIIN